MVPSELDEAPVEPEPEPETVMLPVLPLVCDAPEPLPSPRPVLPSTPVVPVVGRPSSAVVPPASPGPSENTSGLQAPEPNTRATATAAPRCAPLLVVLPTPLDPGSCMTTVPAKGTR